MNAAEVIAPPNNRAVRIIRFGAESSVMAGSMPAGEPVTIDPAAFSADPGDDAGGVRLTDE
jgi:hypothetical protein